MKFFVSLFVTLVLLLSSAATAQQTNVKAVSTQLVRVLHDRDMNKLAEFVHPVKGIRFSRPLPF